MSIYQTIGLAWVIFATVAFTIGMFYFALLGIRQAWEDVRIAAVMREEIAKFELREKRQSYGFEQRN